MSRRRSLAPPRAAAPGEIVFATLVIGVVALLVLPLPTPLLDVLLSANLAFSVVLLLTGLYVAHPLRLSTFPSLLLIATLFRLALNVSSTRLILGQADAGRVIDAFGGFVVQGNYVVGAVVFLILTVIQFVVIAKGSERVAEVAARFSLDAMPGRQMAIDADLRAGALTLAEARARRGDLQRESKLFGALDGAMKFVKGDAIAGMIVTVVNVVGGLVIGIVQRGMDPAEAARTYTLLTIGDGLVSQIPALLVAVAAGLVVTRVAGPDGAASRDLGAEVVDQLSGHPRVFGLSGALLVGLAVVPGLPVGPFGLIGAALIGTNVALVRRDRRRRVDDEDDEPAPTAGSDTPLVPLASPLTVTLGAALAEALRERGQEDALREEIRTLREAWFLRTGVRLPAVRVRWGRGPADHVRIDVYETRARDQRLDPNAVLAFGPADQLAALGGDPVLHPVSGAPGRRLPAEVAAAAEAAGFDVLPLLRQIVLEIAAAANASAERFVGIAEVQAALDAVEASHGALVDAVVPRPVPLARLTGILRRLAAEKVPIRDLRGILEALAEDATEDDDVIALTEIARRGVAHTLMARHAPDGVLRVVLVDPSIEQTVRDAITRDGGRPGLALAPAVTDQILGAFDGLVPRGQPLRVLVASDVRRYLRQLLALRFDRVVVLGTGELTPGVRVEQVAVAVPGRR